MLRFSPPIVPDPPSGADSHVPDARSGSWYIHSRLDYGNAVLVGIPTYLVHRLQSVLNAAARLIYHLRPYDHISDALATLHWLRVPKRVQYKIAVITFKVLHDSAPRYLGPLVAVADLPGRRALRSASTSRLVAPPIKLSTVGRRAIPVAAAQVWNGLPEAVVSSSSLQTFRRQLKTLSFSTFIHLPNFLTVWLAPLHWSL